jgi:putative AdoMet-dependent methyltransferase
MEAKQSKPEWQYDEMKLSGVNYNSTEFSDKYDERHQKMRDFKKEAEERIKLLGLDQQSTVIDMGCGTGAFAINAACYYKKIYAVDVSQLMIKHARKKADEAGIDNIEFCHGGFLTYEHKHEPVDGIVCSLVLHHLPDFWKQAALTRLAQMLRPGGKLLLFDVVLSVDTEKIESSIEEYIKTMIERLGIEMKKELETHFRQEYSTFDWVMEEMLKRAGFKINKSDYKEGFFANYLCTKKDE